MTDDLLEWLDCPCSSEVCLPRAAKARIEAQAAELVRIKERLGWRIEEQAAEIERLRGALKHQGGPLCMARYHPTAECTCGVSAALAGKAEQ